MGKGRQQAEVGVRDLERERQRRESETLAAANGSDPGLIRRNG